MAQINKEKISIAVEQRGSDLHGKFIEEKIGIIY